MKVQGPGSSRGVSKTNKKDSSSESSESDAAAFKELMSSGTSAAAPTGNAQSIAHIDALLAIQEAEDPTQGKARKRMRQRADSILGALDDMRHKMLRGNLTVGDMIDIADVVASHREKVEDPHLTGIMDEIDLRAQVELAKMRVSLDKQEKSA